MDLEKIRGNELPNKLPKVSYICFIIFDDHATHEGIYM